MEKQPRFKTLVVANQIHMIYNADWDVKTSRWMRENQNEHSLDLYFRDNALAVRVAEPSENPVIDFRQLFEVPLENY